MNDFESTSLYDTLNDEDLTALAHRYIHLTRSYRRRDKVASGEIETSRRAQIEATCAALGALRERETLCSEIQNNDQNGETWQRFSNMLRRQILEELRQRVIVSTVEEITEFILD